jgi:hypothetical protein
METNTANHPETVYLLMYTVQQQTSFICGILDPYATAPRARAAIKNYASNLLNDGYTIISTTKEETILFRKVDAQEFRIYFEERKLL